MHENTCKVDCGHTVRSERVRSDGIGTVLEASPNDEKEGNQTGLNREIRLEEETTKEGICETKCNSELSVSDMN